MQSQDHGRRPGGAPRSATWAHPGHCVSTWRHTHSKDKPNARLAPEVSRGVGHSSRRITPGPGRRLNDVAGELMYRLATVGSTRATVRRRILAGGGNRFAGWLAERARSLPSPSRSRPLPSLITTLRSEFLGCCGRGGAGHGGDVVLRCLAGLAGRPVWPAHVRTAPYVCACSALAERRTQDSPRAWAMSQGATPSAPSMKAPLAQPVGAWVLK